MPALIRMDGGEGPLIEVDLRTPEAQLAAAGEVVHVVQKRFESIVQTLRTVIVPFSNTWKELSREVEIAEATMTLSLGITAEGNFFVAKSEASATIEVELKMTPKKVSE